MPVIPRASGATVARRLVLLVVALLTVGVVPAEGARTPLACRTGAALRTPCVAATCPRGTVANGRVRGTRKHVCRRPPKCRKGTKLAPSRKRCIAIAGRPGPVPQITPSGVGPSSTAPVGSPPSVVNTTPVPTGKIAPLPNGRVMWGVWASGSYFGLPNAPFSMVPLDDFEQRAGKRVSIVHWGQPWEIDGVQVEFPTAAMTSVRDRGSIPMLDWGSWDTRRDGVVQPAYRLANITAGAHDVFIERFANAAKAWGHPFFLSLDPEMNGYWPTWSEQVNGNAPGDFARMWRHVHDVFERVGVTNVTWVWQVNTKYTGSIPIRGLYPGDADVDWVGISGYSWGTHPDRDSGWFAFDRLFTPIVNDITAVAPTKPVMIAETGASDFGGSKADWITDALTYEIPKRFLSIRALLWFNAFDHPYDWAIQSSPAAQAAFASGISLPLYATNEFGGLLP